MFNIILFIVFLFTSSFAFSSADNCEWLHNEVVQKDLDIKDGKAWSTFSYQNETSTELESSIANYFASAPIIRDQINSDGFQFLNIDYFPYVNQELYVGLRGSSLLLERELKHSLPQLITNQGGVKRGRMNEYLARLNYDPVDQFAKDMISFINKNADPSESNKLFLESLTIREYFEDEVDTTGGHEDGLYYSLVYSFGDDGTLILWKGNEVAVGPYKVGVLSNADREPLIGRIGTTHKSPYLSKKDRKFIRALFVRIDRISMTPLEYYEMQKKKLFKKNFFSLKDRF